MVSFLNQRAFRPVPNPMLFESLCASDALLVIQCVFRARGFFIVTSSVVSASSLLSGIGVLYNVGVCPHVVGSQADVHWQHPQERIDRAPEPGEPAYEVRGFRQVADLQARMRWGPSS